MNLFKLFLLLLISSNSFSENCDEVFERISNYYVVHQKMTREKISRAEVVHLDNLLTLKRSTGLKTPRLF